MRVLFTKGMIAADFSGRPDEYRIGHALPNAPCEWREAVGLFFLAAIAAVELFLQRRRQGPPRPTTRRRYRPRSPMPRTIPDPCRAATANQTTAPVSSPTSACRSPGASLVHVLERRFIQSPWAERAADLGWDAASLFGCHPGRPLDHLQGAGLLWRISGSKIVAMGADWATIEIGGQRIIHRRPSPLRAAISGGKITAMQTDWATIEIAAKKKVDLPDLVDG